MRNIRAVSFIAFVTLFFSLSCWAHDGPPLPENRDLDTLMSEFDWDVRIASSNNHTISKSVASP